MANEQAESEKRGPGPTLALIILGVVIALLAAVLVLHPKPPGAVGNSSSQR